MKLPRARTVLVPLPLVLAACAGPGREPAQPSQPAPAPAPEPPPEAAPMAVAQALDSAAAWLERQQAPDGLWSDEAQGTNDVGVSALAMLALMRGSTDGVGGPHAAVVRAGADALVALQEADSGLIGDQVGHAYMYRHGIATLALCELYARCEDPALLDPARLAVNQVLRARNPYAAWRYDVPPIGDNDTSVTSWMLQALVAAEGAGIEIDRDAYAGGLSWIDKVTDPATGRVGYDSPGSTSSRIPRVNDHLPPEMGEAMTAAGLAARAELGQRPEGDPIMTTHAKVLRRKLPDPGPWDDLGADLYYWYHGTRAMKAMGGDWWQAWRRAVSSTLVETQRDAGDRAGSWDPVDPWSAVGGRVYTTALAVLALAECR